jgi:hypothetical protein
LTQSAPQVPASRRRASIGCLAATCLLVSAGTLAQESGSVADRLGKAGVTACRGIVSEAVGHAAGGAPFNTAHVSNTQSPNTRAVHMVAIVKYDDAPQIASVTGAPVAGGGCDMTMTQVFWQAASCADMRKEAEGGWRFVGDVNGAMVLAENTQRGGIMHLVGVPGGCMVVKTTTSYPEQPAR